jgi:peroxin-19
MVLTPRPPSHCTPADIPDMLDEFSATKIDSKAPAPVSQAPSKLSTSGSERPPHLDQATLPEDDFAHQLQSGMADMLKELEENPDMARQFEEMMAQLGAPLAQMQATSTVSTDSKAAPSAGAQPRSAATRASAAPASAPPFEPQTEKDFQSTIRKTMERMQASSDSVSTAASTSTDDDMLATLLREMQSANGGADGTGDDSFSKMLLGMMEQLTNKEVLYEPMKELDQKFPAWLESKKGTLPKEDEERYKKQRGLVREIVARFERKGYSDGNAEDREFVVDRMQKVSQTRSVSAIWASCANGE